MKRVSLFVVLVVVLSTLLTACGGGTTSSDKIRIALILPSTIDDMAWSQSMYEGILAIQEELGMDKVDFEYSESLGNPVDAGAAIREYADKGFNIIIAHGSQYQSVLDEVAPDYPEVSFAYGTGYQSHDNIFAYDPQAQEGAYLHGMMAGLMTQSNIVGIVGPVEAGDAIKYNYGFQQGVEAVNPDVDVRIAYTGSFGDIPKAAELAKAHMDAGADFLTGTAQQVVGAITAVKERDGVYWLSNDMDQSPLAPDAVLSAQTYDWVKVLKQIIEYRENGTMGGEHLSLSLANGEIKMVYNPNVEGNVPQDVKDAVEEAKQQIIKGELEVALPD
ncbi:MAG: BMP family protein [Anaerolineae bacterium]|nr:BMP family protein [Anaerolineae bacterium]